MFLPAAGDCCALRDEINVESQRQFGRYHLMINPG